jgi:hypothetical protein
VAPAETPIEVDGATLVIVLGSRPSVGFVTENDATAVRHLEPAFKAHRLRLKDVRPAEQIPQCRLTFVNEKVANPSIYSVHEVCITGLDEGGIPIVATVLNQRSITESQQRRTFPHPLLEWCVARQLVEVVALAAEPHPPADSRWIPESPQHRDFVVPKDHCRVRAVTRVSQSADAEHAGVDQVAEKDRVPLGGGVGLEGLEEPLEIAVHVAHDQNRQISHETDASLRVG